MKPLAIASAIICAAALAACGDTASNQTAPPSPSLSANSQTPAPGSGMVSASPAATAQAPVPGVLPSTYLQPTTADFVITEPGAHYENIDVTGNFTVNAPGCSLYNSVIRGDLTITNGDSGGWTLKNVTVIGGAINIAGPGSATDTVFQDVAPVTMDETAGKITADNLVIVNSETTDAASPNGLPGR